MSDPFAAAAVPAAGAVQPSNASPFSAASTPTAAPDPNANPFASPDSVGGGGGPRGPKWSDLVGRICVLKPIELRKDVPMDPKVDPTPGKVQDIYVTDLTVLGAQPVKVWDPSANEGQGADLTYNTPFTWTRWFAYGRGVHVKLSGVQENPAALFLLGVVRRCPTGAGYRKNETWQDAERSWDAYRAAMAAGREIAKPQFSWGLVDCTPEETAVALAWYRGQ